MLRASKSSFWKHCRRPGWCWPHCPCVLKVVWWDGGAIATGQGKLWQCHRYLSLITVWKLFLFKLDYSTQIIMLKSAANNLSILSVLSPHRKVTFLSLFSMFMRYRCLLLVTGCGPAIPGTSYRIGGHFLSETNGPRSLRTKKLYCRNPFLHEFYIIYIMCIYKICMWLWVSPAIM